MPTCACVLLQGSSNGQVQLLLNSSLSLNVISAGVSTSADTAWVLDSRVGGGPVAGAEVFVYGVQNYQARTRTAQLSYPARADRPLAFAAVRGGGLHGCMHGSPVLRRI